MAPLPACALGILALVAAVSATGNYTRPEGSPVGNVIIEQPNPPVCPTGCKGEDGPEGPQGRLGRPGVRGTPGMPGIPGYDGWSTWAGWKENYRVQAVKGGRGPEGSVGPPGTSGKDGTPGAQGAAGPAGALGQDGMGGPRGLPGSPGEMGSAGPGGPRGPRGPDGAMGAIGAAGSSGAKGDQGDMGRTGTTGNVGRRGDSGSPGVPGPKGSLGEQGEQGYQGEKGFKGSNGDQGVVGATGARGDRGATGEVGLEGMVGETGEQGLMGEIGSQGSKGDSGPYIEKIGVNETNSCGAGNNGKVKFDPYLKKLYFCNGNSWLCVKSQVCDEPCRVSDWGTFGPCSATCGTGTQTRWRFVESKAGPNNDNPCPPIMETRACASLPACSCPDPGQPANGVRFGDDFSILATVSWQCNSGFRLVGATQSVCRVDPDSGAPAFSTRPTCSPIACPRLDAPQNGGVVQASPALYNSEATFSCSSGYSLSNRTALRCTEAGLWSFRPPTCVPNTCPDPGAPANGARNATSATFVFGTVLAYTCNAGYTMSGAQTISCTASGAFSGVPPTCVAIDCGRLANPDNGVVATTPSTVYGSSAQYTCNAGYRLQGDVYRVCQSSGAWSGSPAVCQLIDCGDPGTVTNGAKNSQTTTYNSVVSFTCNQGYRLFGSASRTCQGNELWSGSQPTCQIVDCGHPGTPGNGQVQVSATTFDSVATFVCSTGYVLLGSARRECQANGQWSGTQPVCNAIICEDPGTPENGGRDGSSLRLESTVSYFCNPGYQLVGSRTRTCRANRRFDGTLPSCQIISCANPGAPENGARQGNDFTYTSQVSFTCNAGYELSGSRMRICLADATWSGRPAVCNQISCPAPVAPANGAVSAPSVIYNSLASYSCNDGYKLVGAQVRTCQANADWSLSTPECQLITCCAQTAPTNGEMIGNSFSFGNQIGFRCNAGFSLTGSENRNCQTDGSWTGVPPACEPLFCVDPGLVQNGIRTEISLAVDGVAAYQCNAGYRLVGQATLTCQDDATWSHPLPSCILDLCQDPGTPDNGRRIGDSFLVGSSVNYVCNDGFTLSGSVSLRCLTTGFWSSPRPTCDPNCLVSVWSDWGVCSVTCLDGTQTRTRDILQAPAGAGTPCPERVENRGCRPRDDCGCGDFPVGNIHSAINLQAQSVATDVVVVVDESSSMAFYHQWLAGTVNSLQQALVADGIGSDPNLPNHYALVGFGRFPLANGSDAFIRPHAFSNTRGEKVFTIDSYAQVNSQLREGGNIEDGYLAIDYALKEITDDNGKNLLRLGRPDVAINVIFITDEDRDVLVPYGNTLTRSGIKNLVRGSNAVLNVVVDQEIYGDNRQAFGYDSEKLAYIVEPNGAYRNTTVGARLGQGYNSTRRQYTTMALELGGAAWNIKILREGGPVGDSFTNAFLKVKTKEIKRQIRQCRRCTCLDVGRVSELQCLVVRDQDVCFAEAESQANGGG